MYNNARKLLGWLFISLCFLQGNAQTTTYKPRELSVAAMRQDFTLLRDTLQKVHPGIYRYKTKQQMDKIFDSCYASIKSSMPLPQFYMLISYAVAAMEDGHSNARMPRDEMNALIDSTKIFPAMAMLIHNCIFVYCCNQNAALAGSEIVAINNKPAPQIVQRMLSYITSDADIQSRKNWEINEAFPLFYTILYGNTGAYNVTYKTADGQIKNATLQPGVYKSFSCPPPFTHPKKYLQLTYRSGNIAVLTVKTFFDGFLQQTGENFQRFLDSAFNDINAKKAQKLIIDIRNNQGGNDGNGALLYAYLTQKPFMYYASQETVTEKFPADDEHPNLKLQQPKPNSYTGKVFILANGFSFSASAEFSAVARSNKRALFIGEEVGGGYYGNTSGDDITVTLPNSKIDCRVPLVKYTSAVKKEANKGNGILPDYPAYPAIQDFINHTDGLLEYAVQIAGKN